MAVALDLAWQSRHRIITRDDPGVISGRRQSSQHKTQPVSCSSLLQQLVCRAGAVAVVAARRQASWLGAHKDKEKLFIGKHRGLCRMPRALLGCNTIVQC